MSFDDQLCLGGKRSQAQFNFSGSSSSAGTPWSDRLVDHLRDALLADLVALGNFGSGSIARRTRERFTAVAESFPPMLLLLAEPWLQSEPTPSTLDLLTGCARIHLYARILDDALDENLPLNRALLLRAQPLFWRAQGLLSAQFPLLVDACADLIAETTTAVEADDNSVSPALWGAKNHHLLLAPLLLSGANAAYQSATPGLSAFIAAAQAVEEWRQGVTGAARVQGHLLVLLGQWTSAPNLDALLLNGWQGAARRLISDSRWLVEKLTACPI